MAKDKIEFSTKIDTIELQKKLEETLKLIEDIGAITKKIETTSNDTFNSISKSIEKTNKNTEEANKTSNNFLNTIKNIGKNSGEAFNKLQSGFKKIVDISKQAFKAVGDLSKKVYELGKQSVDKLKTGFIALGGAITGIVASSVKVGAEFEAIMTDVGVLSGLALDGSETALKQMELLENRAKEIGRTTQFSAKQAGEGFKMMAMAGYNATDMLNALPNAMSLAGATGENLELVIERMVNNLNAFGMSSEEAGRYADVIATATTKVTTNVAELTEAFLEAGTISNSFGINIEDTSIALGVLADNGIKGSKAGTAYKNMLLGLNAPTTQAKKVMDEYNLSVVKNADGNMDLIGTLADMREKLKDVDNETKANILTTIVGREAYAGLNVLLNTSSERFEELGNAIYNSTGNANKMTELMLDNLQGQLTILSSSFEGLQLSIFDNIGGITKEGVTFINNSLNEVTEAIEQGKINEVPKILGRVLSEGILKIGESLPNLIEIVSNSINTFLETLSENSENFVTIGQNILNSLLDGIRTQIPVLYEIIQTLAPTIANFFINFAPLMFEMGINIITALIEGIGNNPEQLISSITNVITNLIDTITQNLPIFLEQGINVIFALIDGINENLPAIIDVMILVITQLIQTIIENLPQFIQKGLELINSIIEGISQNTERIITAIIDLIGALIQAMIENLPLFVEIGIKLIGELIKGIVTATPQIIQKLLDLGTDLVNGLWTGIKNAWSWLVDSVKNLGKNLINSVKGIFGIKSPSRVFKQIGLYLDEGLKEGIEQGANEVVESAENVATSITQTTQEELNKALDIQNDYYNNVKKLKEQELSLIDDTNREYINQLDNIKALYNTSIDKIKEFKSENEDLNILASRGLNTNILEELESMGIQAQNQIDILNNMTDTELKEFELTWGIKFENISITAEEQLELLKIQNEEKLQEIRENTIELLTNEKEIYIEKMTELVEESTDILNLLPMRTPEIGTVAIQNLEQAILQAKPQLQNTLNNMINSLILDAQNKLMSALSSLQSQYNNAISSFSASAPIMAYSYGGSFSRGGVTTRTLESTYNYMNNSNNKTNRITQNFNLNNRNLSPYETAKKIKQETKNIL